MSSVRFADSQDVMQLPITHSEMRALLKPLENCIQQLERTIQECSSALPLADKSRLSESRAPDHRDFDSPVHGSTGATSALHSDENIHVPKGLFDIDRTSNTETYNKTQFLQCASINEVLKANSFLDNTNYNVAHQMVLKMQKKLNWWNNFEEPERVDSFVYRFGVSRLFDVMAMSIIIFNSVLVAYTADWQIRNLGVKEPNSFDILEKSCLAWFVFELTVRLLTHQHHFFLNSDWRWNMFDFVLVAISVVNFGFEVASSAEGSNVGFMRVLRLLKLAKIFRSMRSFRFVKSLQLLLDSFQKSFHSLFWGLVMLIFILYIFAQIFLQAMIEYFTSDYADLSMKSDAMNKFGSLGTTLLSLYMSVTGGDDWGHLYTIVSETGAFYGSVLIFFTFFFIFALFNILTALLVEKAMTQSKPERAQVIFEQRRRITEERETFLKVCQAMDLDGNGTISWEEFQEWMCNPVMLSYMASIGIEIHDVELFFKHVGARAGRDSKLVATGEITIGQFVEGLMHMKGAATSLDMQRQLFEMHLLSFEVKSLHESFDKKMHHLKQLVTASLQPCQAEQPRTATFPLHKRSSL